MKINKKASTAPVFTFEGGRAIPNSTPLKELRRMTLAALLWEDSFYESGSVQAQKVAELVAKCRPQDIQDLAIECRNKMYLRHMPLFLIRELARQKKVGGYVAAGLQEVIQRPDELGEFIALCWIGKKESLSAGSKRGLRAAFQKFNEYDLGKYNRDAAIKLKDVMRLVHPTPKDEAQSLLWRRLIAGTLATPDTWEVALSAGGDKKEVFERLLKEKKLGGLAFLRNLRNMIQSGVDSSLIEERFEGKFGKVLPFRFVAALRYAPKFVNGLNTAMLNCVKEVTPFKGRTAILVDVSGSMDAALSSKSEMQRIDVGAGLAVLIACIAEKSRVFTFSSKTVEVPPYQGLALVDTILHSQEHSSTYLGEAVKRMPGDLDRLIVITDEQSHDRVDNPPPGCRGYIINVASYSNGVGFGPWTRINGWSERVIDYIQAVEGEGEDE